MQLKKYFSILPKHDIKAHKDYMTDQKLLLTFRNHKGNVTASEIGIAPISLQIEER